MTFLVWAARAFHLFSAIVWLGGVLFLSAVSFPVAEAEGNQLHRATLHHIRRFLPFVWMSIWSLLVSGIVLMLSSHRYIFGSFGDLWNIALGAKQAVFLAMVVFSFGFARMCARASELAESDAGTADIEPFYLRMRLFGRITVGLALIALLLAAAMV